LSTRSRRSPVRLTDVGADAPASLLAVLGALCIAGSPIFVALADTTPGTAAFYRSLLALPLLWPLARRTGAPGRLRGRAWAAGVLLAVDLLLWNQSIADAGAGIATVIANTQVIVLPLLAWLLLGERPERWFAPALPLLVLGIALAGGIGQAGAVGAQPLRGTLLATVAGLCYAGFLFLLRESSRAGETVGSIFDVTVAAMLASLLLGALWHGIDFTPGTAAIGWLAAQAVTGQVIGWLLLGAALPRLSAALGGSILLLQPVGALALGVVVLAEQPSALQLLGCLLVLAVILAAVRLTARRGR
jgi:drug/metabolite transporter (DMT)-like permease